MAHRTLLGSVFQPGDALNASEGQITLAGWDETDGYERRNVRTRRKRSQFGRQISGMGLLEAITEADILANADPDDTDGDGIGGVVRIVIDPAVTHDRSPDGRVVRRSGIMAKALRTDMAS